MRVLRFTHRGLTCAIPNAQVQKAGDRPDPDTKMVDLFEGTQIAAGNSYLTVSAAAGPVVLRVTAPEIVDLDDPKPLPALLRERGTPPHVVGWSEDPAGAHSSDGIVWLVDLSRL